MNAAAARSLGHQIEVKEDEISSHRVTATQARAKARAVVTSSDKLRAKCWLFVRPGGDTQVWTLSRDNSAVWRGKG